MFIMEFGCIHWARGQVGRIVVSDLFGEVCKNHGRKSGRIFFCMFVAGLRYHLANKPCNSISVESSGRFGCLGLFFLFGNR